MRVTSKGQVTIPIEIRQKAGLLPGTEVEFQMAGKRVYIEKADGSSRGRRVVQSLRGQGTVRLSTDQILALTRGE